MLISLSVIYFLFLGKIYLSKCHSVVLVFISDLASFSVHLPCSLPLEVLDEINNLKLESICCLF